MHITLYIVPTKDGCIQTYLYLHLCLADQPCVSMSRREGGEAISSVWETLHDAVNDQRQAKITSHIFIFSSVCWRHWVISVVFNRLGKDSRIPWGWFFKTHMFPGNSYTYRGINSSHPCLPPFLGIAAIEWPIWWLSLAEFLVGTWMKRLRILP